MEYIRFEGKRHFVSPPSYVPGQKWGDKLHYGPPTRNSGGTRGGTRPPRPPVIYATGRRPYALLLCLYTYSIRLRPPVTMYMYIIQ